MSSSQEGTLYLALFLALFGRPASPQWLIGMGFLGSPPPVALPDSGRPDMAWQCPNAADAVRHWERHGPIFQSLVSCLCRSSCRRTACVPQTVPFSSRSRVGLPLCRALFRQVRSAQPPPRLHTASTNLLRRAPRARQGPGATASSPSDRHNPHPFETKRRTRALRQTHTFMALSCLGIFTNGAGAPSSYIAFGVFRRRPAERGGGGGRKKVGPHDHHDPHSATEYSASAEVHK